MSVQGLSEAQPHHSHEALQWRGNPHAKYAMCKRRGLQSGLRIKFEQEDKVEQTRPSRETHVMHGPRQRALNSTNS